MASRNPNPTLHHALVDPFTGIHLLRNPTFNKGMSFTHEERKKYKLRGLLPPRVLSIEVQMTRVLESLNRKKDDLEKYIYMMALLDRNESLFYYVVTHNVVELMPIIYTPVVGLACQQFGHIYRRPQGLFITLEDKGHIAEILNNWPVDDVQVIVVTDGERILGLGDLGAHGMGIPVGKLALYTACAGVDPHRTLPITLDVGTNNETLLADPLYVGLNQHRVRGAVYDEFLDEFVWAVQKRWPSVLLQFEDFANLNAFPLLKKYRDRICTFNDDIQGTAAVTLAGLIAATKITNIQPRDQKVLFLGAGEAGIGIGELFASYLIKYQGLNKEEAHKRCFFFDSKGLVVKSRTDLNEHKHPFAHNFPFASEFVSAVNSLKPTAIVGVSAQPGVFSKPVIEAMAQHNEHPIIFALSNPTSKAECTAEQAYKWSNGKAVFASGSPFNPVTLGSKTFYPGQGNNAYIFPGVGLGVVAAQAKHVTDEMFLDSAETLANCVTQQDLDEGRVYPPLPKIRTVSIAIAKAIVQRAFRDNLARVPPVDDLDKFIHSIVFEPAYRSPPE